MTGLLETLLASMECLLPLSPLPLCQWILHHHYHPQSYLQWVSLSALQVQSCKPLLCGFPPPPHFSPPHSLSCCLQHFQHLCLTLQSGSVPLETPLHYWREV